MPRRKGDHPVLQGTLFEHDYLRRSLGALSSVPDVALTELIANAWDAGASLVRIEIPGEAGSLLSVEDDGTGMSPEEFRRRWMTLGYDRIQRQGPNADFPPERKEWRRRAYGRYGLGRHGMLCFANTYTVETWKNDRGVRALVATSEGVHPFEIISFEEFQAKGHGTRLKANAERNIPQISRIRDVLSGRFMHDPQFRVLINNESVSLEEHEGLVETHELVVDGVRLNLYVVDSSKTARRSRHHGVAFWVGGRLVGEPSWIIGAQALADRRTAVAKRHTVVVRTDDLYDHVLPDWTGFQRNETTGAVMSAVAEYLERLLSRLMADRVAETRVAVLRQHSRQLSELRPLARTEVGEFVEMITEKQPSISQDVLAIAVQAVINLEKSRSGLSLLQRLSELEPHDVAGLDRILRDWTVRDALVVLDEIDRRIAVIEALDRLSSEKDVDELETLHPLVTQARWLFGPEFDSPLYTSNTTLRKVAETILKKEGRSAVFPNPKRRPDLIVIADRTLSIVGTEQIDTETSVCVMEEILLIELKRGGSSIGRDELGQAQDYVDQLLNSGLLDGRPRVRAFVVGHELRKDTSQERKVGDSGHVYGRSYGQLVRTASKRLFRLREELSDRYGEMKDTNLIRTAMSGGVQLELNAEPSAEGTSAA